MVTEPVPFCLTHSMPITESTSLAKAEVFIHEVPKVRKNLKSVSHRLWFRSSFKSKAWGRVTGAGKSKVICGLFLQSQTSWLFIGHLLRK
jgi:hypothetical protein